MPRFGRFRAGNKPRRLVLGVHPIPTLVTLGNLICGFGAIVLAMRAHNPPRDFHGFTTNDCIYYSAILIFVAMIFDVLDGTVARLTKTTSKFGMEMDSLCDVVSFGVAPAVLVKAMIDISAGTAYEFPMRDRYVFLMMIVYVCCAAMRLARYNVEAETGHRNFFFGMPSPGAAGCVASLALMIVPSSHPFSPLSPLRGQLREQLSYLDNLNNTVATTLYGPLLLALPFMMLLLGLLMVSRVHYQHVGARLLRGKKSFGHIMILGLLLVLIVMQLEIMLAVAFNGYMLFGLLNEVRYQFFPSQRPPEWIAAEAALNPPAKTSGSTLPSVSSPPPSTETPQTPPQDPAKS